MTHQETKQEAIDILRRQLSGDGVAERLERVDVRLLEYFEGVARDVGTKLGEESDRHSVWEVLCAVKFLRLFNTYYFNTKQVQFYISLREGTWEKKGNTWHYIEGGLKLPATVGAKVYRWEPFQIFVLASVFGFYTWFDTHQPAGSKAELLPTEREKYGSIYDFRRMVTEFILYAPRKVDKTGISAYIQFIFFLFGDFNAEIYSLGNTEDQSKILYSRTRFMLNQVNVSESGGKRFRMTEKVTQWQKQFQAEIRNSKIVPLTAGGKAPDGTNTQLLNWDELGSSPYINGKSDMQAHIGVCQSSMGMRREPLTFGTTTAGTITTGPFIDKLQSMHESLMKEIDYFHHRDTPTLSGDRQLCLLYEPDEYEKTEEQYVISSHALRRKVNPMLGITVQYQFYDDEMEKARQEGGQKLSECVSKLFNIYSSGRIREWIKAEQVRPLQTDMRISDCIASEGWVVFVGMDFSQGDDLHVVSYLAARRHPSGRGTQFFADCDAWIKESTLEATSIRPLYDKWIEQGWLHVSPGKVFQPALFINKLSALLEAGVQFLYFGYDKYQSKDPINSLKAFLQSVGVADPEPYVQVVSQLNSELNAPTDDLYAAMFAQVPFISYSKNPLWPWCFGNCVLDIDGRDNKRPIKRTHSDSCKVDPVQALINALDLYERFEGLKNIK